VSVGKRSVIKCVQLDSLFEDANHFNLCLYDYNENAKTLSDNIVTNNGDVEKVFVTIAYCLNHFFISYPKASVFFEGNSPSRNRLYRLQINRYRHLWNDQYLFEIISKQPDEILFSIIKKN
jgi:hypothetical protein